MNNDRFQPGVFRLRRGTARLLRSAALVLIVAFALTSAAEDRAVKTRVAPIYPEIAKRMRASGTVNIEATLDASGNVTDAKAVDGNRLLAPAAEDAVRKWKFESGAGVSKVKVEVNFALSQ
jgi:TonB family protein